MGAAIYQTFPPFLFFLCVLCGECCPNPLERGGLSVLETDSSS